MKKWIALGIVVIALVAGGAWWYNYRQTLFEAAIDYSHAHDVQVLDISERQDGGNDKVMATLTRSGQHVDLPKTGTYIVAYKGDTGYKDDFVSISPSDPTATISPDYSDDKNTEVAKTISPLIRAAILAAYPATTKYFTIGDCNLTQQATWCAVMLHYTGEYSYNSDDLRVLLHYTGGKWQLATKPDIILTTTNYPDVPESILSWANGIDS